MDEEDVMHIYNGILFIHAKEKKNASFVVMWMDLEAVIHSEVSQKEKYEYYILMHIYSP